MRPAAPREPLQPRHDQQKNSISPGPSAARFLKRGSFSSGDPFSPRNRRPATRQTHAGKQPREPSARFLFSEDQHARPVIRQTVSSDNDTSTTTRATPGQQQHQEKQQQRNQSNKNSPTTAPRISSEAPAAAPFLQPREFETPLLYLYIIV